MKKLLMLGLLASYAALADISFVPKPVPTPPPQADNKTIVFTASNHIVINEEIDGTVVANAQQQLAALKTNKPIIFLDTPGGSIYAGMDLVNQIVSSPKEITCVASFAASMGFVIFQSCHKRLVLNQSLIMQHQATYGIRDSDENFKSYFTHLQHMLDLIKKAQANRIGISSEKFHDLVRHDWWLYGEDAVKEKAADSVVSVQCTEDLLLEKKKQSVMTFWGPITLTFSKCPFITAPLELDFEGIYDTTAKREIYTQFMGQKTKTPVPMFPTAKSTPVVIPTPTTTKPYER